MIRFCIGLLAASIAFSASFPTAKPEEAGMSSDRLKRIRAGLQGYIDREEIAGAVSLVARRGRVVHLESVGLADREKGSRMQTDAMFRIASMTKPITSLAVMMLYEEGRLQLTDPVSKFIPEFKNPRVAVLIKPYERTLVPFTTVPAKREITIHDLLTHTAGLPTGTAGITMDLFNKMVRGPEETMGDMVKQLAKLPLNFQPGTAWEYGNATDVLGYVVEVISGMTLDRFFETRIFQPLGMSDTYFNVPEAKRSRVAPVYEPTAPKGLRLAVIAPRSPRYFAGGGGLVSTASDYVRFCQMMLNGGEWNGVRFLSRKTVELMTANHIGNIPLWPVLAGNRFGLGYRVLTNLGEANTLGSIGSYGWGGAYGTYFWIDPKEQTIGILMVQVRPYDHLNLRADFQTLVTQALVD